MLMVLGLLKSMAVWQFGTHKEWKNPISKQGWLIKKTANMEEVHHFQTHLFRCFSGFIGAYCQYLMQQTWRVMILLKNVEEMKK